MVSFQQCLQHRSELLVVIAVSIRMSAIQLGALRRRDSHCGNKLWTSADMEPPANDISDGA